jgi:hypothetical protein
MPSDPMIPAREPDRPRTDRLEPMLPPRPPTDFESLSAWLRVRPRLDVHVVLGDRRALALRLTFGGLVNGWMLLRFDGGAVMPTRERVEGAVFGPDGFVERLGRAAQAVWRWEAADGPRGPEPPSPTPRGGADRPGRSYRSRRTRV